MFGWLVDTKEVLGVVIALITVSTATWKGYKAHRLRMLRKRAEEKAQRELLNNLSATVQRLEPMLQDVQHELKANNGGSLRDELVETRNEFAVERTARRVLTQAASFEVAVLPNNSSRVLFVSPAFVKMTGLTRDDAEDSGWVRAIHPNDRSRVQAEARIAFDEATVHSTTYTAQNVHTGSTTYVEHTGTPVLNSRGAMVGWIVMLIPRTHE